jgi:hypothetical protein
MPTQEKINEVLEKRVEFMVQFIVSMELNGIPERVINYFEAQDRDFLYNFCDKLDIEPDKYIQEYDRRVR